MTGDGLPVSELVRKMREDGYDARYPMQFVQMPPGPGDSPLKPGQAHKMVSMDTRRLSAARAVAKMAGSENFRAAARVHEANDPAPVEYEQLRHLTFQNRKIPPWVRTIWIAQWNEWHKPEMLTAHGIVSGSWGHLIKLRMAMSTNVERSAQAATNAGFKKSPDVRKSRAPGSSSSSSSSKPRPAAPPSDDTPAKRSHPTGKIPVGKRLFQGKGKKTE